ncbi:MAG: response regulator [Geitlerinemataceae cyanobacterium]
MQGNLNEIDIRSILQLIALGQRTGELFIETYRPSSGRGDRPSHDALDRSWFVFFANGQIVYAAEVQSQHERLRDCLRFYQLDRLMDEVEFPNLAATNTPEYACLWYLLENHHLTPVQGRTILCRMVRETLFELLELHQGSFIFDMGPALAPQLMTLPVASLVTKIVQQTQDWKRFYPHVQSVDQCPTIVNLEALQEKMPEKAFETLRHFADGNTSLRRMARALNRDIAPIAKALYPYVQAGSIQLQWSLKAERNRTLRLRQFEDSVPRVVCIDDERTIRKAVEVMLEPHGYEISTIGSSLKALSLLFPLQPDLILCDITMPEPDGYELCAMLRRSRVFREMPIIMLTGRDGFTDRVKARMVGATDYLTKPFSEQELLMLLEQYIGPGVAHANDRASDLEAAFRDALDSE